MNILEDNRSNKSWNSSNNGIMMTTPADENIDTKNVEEPLKEENWLKMKNTTITMFLTYLVLIFTIFHHKSQSKY